jgi:hypothetical protein
MSQISLFSRRSFFLQRQVKSVFPLPSQFGKRSFSGQSKTDNTHKQKLVIFDTTLRDGEQSPG